MRLAAASRRFYLDGEGEGTADPGLAELPLRLHHVEELSLTDGLLERAYGDRGQGVELADLGYVRREGMWWSHSDVQLWYGDEKFYLPAGEMDYRGYVEKIEYDDGCRMQTAVVDPFGLCTLFEPDFAAMKPAASVDPNGSRAEVVFDGFGRVLGTRHLGVEQGADGSAVHVGPEQNWDPPVPPHLWEETPDLIDQVAGDPESWLRGLDTLHITDHFAFERSGGTGPSVVVVDLIREQAEGPEPAGGPGMTSGHPEVALTIRYCDGFGRPVQSKQPAGPGEALILHPGGELEAQQVDRRWKVSAGVRYDNKGRMVHQYEPLYSATHRFEPQEVFTRHGTGPRFRYDSLGRHVRTDEPGGFLSRMSYFPWRVETRDANDTILESFTYKARVVTGLLEGAGLEAIRRAEAHADTPEIAHLAPGGFPVLRDEWADADTRISIRSRHDAFGRVYGVLDPRTGEESIGLLTDLAGRTIRSYSRDAGERQVLFDAAGHGVMNWTARGECFETRFDAAWRVVAVDLHDPQRGGGPVRVERYLYGEELPDREEARRRNLLGRLWKQYDQAGEQHSIRYGSKGRLLEKRRRLALEWRELPDWSDTSALESEELVTRYRFDTLGRVLSLESADGVEHRMAYGPEGELVAYRFNPNDGTTERVVLEGARYDAAGRLLMERFGNGVESSRRYDPETGRLARLLSRCQDSQDDGTGPVWKQLQEVDYTWDPAGNLIRKDDRTREHLLGHLPAELNEQNRYGDYTYDALYRLVRAGGWTHRAMQAEDEVRSNRPPQTSGRHLSLNDAGELVPYVRHYRYDHSGNLLRLRQTGPVAWTRGMWVSESSNRSLPATVVEHSPGTDPESRFDAAGNLKQLDHLEGELSWSWRGELLQAIVIAREEGEEDAEWYRYGSTGNRIRRIEQRLEHGRPVRRETIWLDGCEIRREIRDGEVVRVRSVSKASWRGRTFALLERTVAGREPAGGPAGPVMRFQLADHRGSVALELGEQAELISYEEFFPYGGTAFMAGDAARESSAKRYRYNGGERDEATGLYAVGMRYYAPWLCRWVSPDPSGPSDGLNLYAYLRCSPVQRVDPSGLKSRLDEEYQKNRDAFQRLGHYPDPGREYVYEVFMHDQHGLVGRVSHMISGQLDDGRFILFPVVGARMLDQDQMIEIHQLQEHFQPEEPERPAPARDAAQREEQPQARPEPDPPETTPSPEESAVSSAVGSAEGAADRAAAVADEAAMEMAADEASASAEQMAETTANLAREAAQQAAQSDVAGERSPDDLLGPVSDFIKLFSSISNATEIARMMFERHLPELKAAVRDAMRDENYARRQLADSEPERNRLAGEMERAEAGRDDARKRAQRARQDIPDLEREVSQARERAWRHHQTGNPADAASRYAEASSRSIRILVLEAMYRTEESFNSAAADHERLRANRPPEPGEWIRKDQELRDTQNRLAGAEAEASRQETARASAERRLEVADRRHRELEAGYQEARGRTSRAAQALKDAYNRADLRFGDSRAARVASNAAPVIRGAATVLGPVGTGLTLYNLATAETDGQRLQAGLDLIVDGVGYIPHPVSLTFSVSYSVTQLVDGATGNRISSGLGDGLYHVDRWISGNRKSDDSVPEYQQTLGWRIAQSLEDRGIRL